MKLNWPAVLLGVGIFFPITFLIRSLGELVTGNGGLGVLSVATLVAGIAAGGVAGALAGRAGLLHGALAGSPWTLVAVLTALGTWALTGTAPSPSPAFWISLVFGPLGGSLGGELGVRISRGRAMLGDLMPMEEVSRRPWSVQQGLLILGAMALTYIAMATFGFRPIGLGAGLLGLGYGVYQGWRFRGRGTMAQKWSAALFMVMGVALGLAAWFGKPPPHLTGLRLWGALLGLVTGGILATFLLSRYSEKRGR